MSELDPRTAGELVESIRAGEPGAEERLVELCGRTLCFLTRRYARTAADGEDLYQETLLLALEKIRRGELQEPEKLAAFLRALAKNLSVQHYRRRRHTAEQGSEFLDETAPFDDPGALDGLLVDERNRLARRTLTELRVPRDRALLLRYYLGEESSARICADLDMEQDHFYRVLHRARTRFKQLWERRRDPAPAP